MSIAPQDTSLFTYLRNRSSLYYGKALELRQTIESWLALVPVTFPHYTRHTVQHSDEIVLQASKLLFWDDDPTRPVLSLSAVEAYILIVTAYLHDAGMVAADSEKIEILASEDWREWTTGDGGGAKRWSDIQTLRAATEPSDTSVRHFLADIQTRFLLAEFIRRTHHIRAAQVIEQHQPSIGRFALDDPILQRTISDVCRAHGYRQHELEDSDHYPIQRDIRGEIVNVRLLAVLLRLADLLDMSSDRACPLLLNATCPLPPDSYAHWSQYQRITHRMTSPHRIELTAECATQDEHRVLQDWCQWIVDEVKGAQFLANRLGRHREWQPPIAALEGPNPTIAIRPAPSATYIPSRWVFELDRDIAYQRLVYDLYSYPYAFLRELLQNSLDATRCGMYSDLRRDGLQAPEYPTQVNAERRSAYPIRIDVVAEQRANPLSTESETRYCISVEDYGVGMDAQIIEKYLLQVGRSYYTTEEFRRNYRFVPTSRYGIGFLSVFAVSDYVTLDTYKMSETARDEPIRLVLTGPRTYLLRERGERRSRGTKVQVALRERVEPGAITAVIRRLCRRVEFPIIVNDFGVEAVIEAETPSDFTYQREDVTKEGAYFVVRASEPVNNFETLTVSI